MLAQPYPREADMNDLISESHAETDARLLLDNHAKVWASDTAAVAQVINRFIIEYGKVEYGKKGNRFALASRPKGYEEVANYLPKPVCVSCAGDVTRKSGSPGLSYFLKDARENFPSVRQLAPK